MDRRFKKIEMSDVKEIVAKKGFYYLPLCRVYDAFCGCRYIIVTEDSNFVVKNPRFANEIIMTSEEFEPYAEIFNAYFANEDRERKRQQLHTDEGYTEDEESNLKISNIDWNPVENTVLANLQNEQICLALEQLTETQRKRVELFYLCGWTERQIAEYEGVNRYAVRKSLDQSIKKLKKFL